ncbi:Aspartyl protease [Saccharicrinis carchari]|uniref:Aspartyl protease n=1 Tax=Saccharicrinis carchari TaxID=1168039 RepID=A0A521CML5_SACCC|nr:retropepsin-like aspartic protease [Saccharicrinis carchari]SMO59930.1 Aspartyl protease [Saccharicrinis carchari]
MLKKILLGIGVLLLLVVILIAGVIYNTISQFKKLDQGELVTQFVTDTIPFTYSASGHIIIPVKINGSKKAYSFILDSGASNFVFSNTQAGCKLESSGFAISMGSKENGFLTKIRKINALQIGGLEFVNLNAKETEMNFDCMEEVYGLMGTGLMRHLVWQLDFDKQVIIVAKRLDELKFQDDKIEIPLYENKYGHHLSTHVKFGKQEKAKELMIDLGSNSTLSLKESSLLMDSLNLKSKRINGMASRGLGEHVKEITSVYRYYLLDSLLFNNSPYLAKNIPIGTSTNSLNLLGLGFFEKFKTTISWKDKILILEPYGSIPDFIWKTSGFSTKYDKEMNKVLIGTVTENTPASRMKIPLHAEVVSIDKFSFSDAASYCNYRNSTLVNDTTHLKIRVDGLIKEYQLIKESIFN